MKKYLLCLLILFGTLYSKGQESKISNESPTLKMTGSSPSLSKGSINTEVLSAIIQKKQEEIKQRVFKNTIIKQFKSSDNSYTQKLNNFTTFHYLYNLMDILTSGKNKSVMTNAAMERSAEFAFIFGMAMYVNPKTVSDSRVIYDPDSKNIILPTESVEDFNILIDLCYDVLLTENIDFKGIFNLKETLINEKFKTWYNADNVYIIETSRLGETNARLEAREASHSIKGKFFSRKEQDLCDQTKAKIKNLDSLRTQVSIKMNELHDFASIILDIKNWAKDSAHKELRAELMDLKNNFSELDSSDLTDKIDYIRLSYAPLLSPQQDASLLKIRALVDANFNQIKHIYNFYIGLKKSDFKDFALTQKQYYALKFILMKYIDVSKNQHPNDAIATVLSFLLENTLIEFNNDAGNLVSAKQAGAGLGYLYVDFESLITNVDQRFSSITQKGLGVYLSPFFGIGTSYASFNKTNALIENDDGSRSSIGNMYFASEKIGIKWKLGNSKYTHAFQAGESYRYFNQLNVFNPWAWTDKPKKRDGSKFFPWNWSGKEWNPDRYWDRPQEEPFISDVHVLAYGSGLLYNVIEIKSEENFNYALVGAGIGLTFFNGLSTNVSIASPVINNALNTDNSFFSFSFDIPIIEYIAALSRKN